MSRLNVAIVGAGLSGLTLALTLRKFAPDVTFDVYEGASQLTEVGAGIAIEDRAWTILKDIGLEAPLTAIVGRGAPSMKYRKSDQAEGIEFSEINLRKISYNFHRPELQNAFLDDLQTSHPVHLRKRLSSYRHAEDGSESIELQFQDGTTATCDVLIGADGVKSAVRGAMYSQLADAAVAAGNSAKAEELRSYISAVFSGSILYRALLRTDELPADAVNHSALARQEMMLYCGKNKHLITYPLSDGHLLNVAASVTVEKGAGSVYDGPLATTVGKEEFQELFSGWEPDVGEIVKHVDSAIKWVANVVNPLPSYVQGRVALLGDAAHAMTPHQGAGAGQGFEDAYLLGKFLSRPDITNENVGVALKVWDAIRRPFSQHVAACSMLCGKTAHFNIPEFAGLTEESSATGTALTIEQLKENVVRMVDLAKWRSTTTITGSVEDALRSLDAALADA